MLPTFFFFGLNSGWLCFLLYIHKNLSICNLCWMLNRLDCVQNLLPSVILKKKNMKVSFELKTNLTLKIIFLGTK